MTSQPLSPRRDDRSPWNTNQGKSCSKEPAFFFQHRGFAGKARGSPVRINAIRQVSNPIFGNSRQRQLVNCLGGVQENRHQRACSVLECMYVCIPYTGTSSRFKGPLPPSPPAPFRLPRTYMYEHLFASSHDNDTSPRHWHGCCHPCSPFGRGTTSHYLPAPRLCSFLLIWVAGQSFLFQAGERGGRGSGG